MDSPELPFGGRLLVAVLVAAGIAGGVGAGPGLGGAPDGGSPPAAVESSPALQGSSPALQESSALQVRIDPRQRVLDSNDPTTFTVTVANPPDAGERYAFLAVGVTPPTHDVGLEVEDRRPWFRDEGKLQWAQMVRLRPGDSRAFGVTVAPESAPGEYELNATIGYVGDASYARRWQTASLTVRSCRSLTGLVACNWQWLLALAGVVVSLLSFVGYRRVRGRVGRVVGGEDAGEQ